MYQASKRPLWPRNVTSEEEIKENAISNAMTDQLPTLAYSRCATICIEGRAASQLTVAL